MNDVGKMLVVLGLALAAIGLIVWGLGRSGFRGLPGDIKYEAQNVRIYFPIITCLLLSALLTAAIWVWQWLTRR